MNAKCIILPLVALAGITFTAFQLSSADAAEPSAVAPAARSAEDPCRISYSDADKMRMAVRRGDTARLQQLLAGGADVNARAALGRTALLWAAYCGETACMQVLLATPGVDVNAADADGITPLAAAATLGHESCVRLLLATPGVDVNKKHVWGTPLAVARDKGHAACADLILAAGGKM